MTLPALVTAFFAAGRAAAVSDDSQALHRFRILAKRLRYAVEILDPEGGKPWLTPLRLVQENLGKMQDAVVAAQFLQHLPSLSALARPLPKRLHAEAAQHILRFRKTWLRYFHARAEEACLAWARTVQPD